MSQRQRKNTLLPLLNKVEWILYSENKIREAVDEYKYKSVINEIKTSENISDPTAFQALKNLTPVNAVMVDGRILNRPEEWLNAIDATYSFCRKRDEQFYQAVKWRYANYATSKICFILGISVEQFYRWLNNFRWLFSLKASGAGLIIPF